MISQTSIQAYHGLKNETTQAERIYEYVVDHGACTIAMIAKGLKMEKSTVSARVNGLVHGTRKQTEPKLEFSHIDKCPVTGIVAKHWRPIELVTPSDFKQLSLDDTQVSVID